MILLAYFISLLIGINIRLNLVLGIIEAIFLVGFIFYRFHKKIALISLGFVLLGLGLSFIRPNYDKTYYQSLVIEVKDNYYIASSGLEKFYISEYAHNHEVGDVLLLKGEKVDLDFANIESGFDFKEYLNNKGVYKQFIYDYKEVKFSNPLKINQIKNRFLANFDDDTSALVGSLLFGKSENESTISLFRELHLTRLITNSGMFLSFFYLFFTYFLKFFLKEKYVKIGGLFLLTLYSVFTYPRFVVIKFIVVHIFRWINEYFLKKRFSYIEILSITGIIFLLFDYHLGYQDSFILSYFIPLIVVISLNSFKGLKKWRKTLFIYVIISLFFVPFSIKYYQELSILSIFFQILYTPFIYIYYLLSILCFFNIPLYSTLNGFTHIFNVTLSFFKPVLFKIYIGDMSQVGMIIYEAFYFIILYLASIKFIDMLKIVVPTFLSIASIYVLPIKPLVTSFVSFINVGQGNSCLIHQGTTTVMIDTGGNINKDIAKECLIPYLKKEQIYDIDLLITTHDDYDHSGAVTSLISNFKVKRYIKDYQLFPIKIGNFTFNNYNVYPNLWEEENDKSLVVTFTLKDYDFLIMGDAPKKIERKIIEDNPTLKTEIPIRRTDLEGTIKYSFIF